MSVDVLVITAVQVECDAVKSYREGIVGDWVPEWTKDEDGARRRYHLAEFQLPDGDQNLKVALARCAMGPGPSSGAATALVRALKPKLLAMCGTCAGNRDETNLAGC